MRAIGIDDVTARLREHDLPSGVLDLPGGGRLLVSQRGGRLMPFLPSGESALWLSPALGDADGFDAFLRRDDWNLGGERIWIAPEIQFTIRDRRDFWGSYALPAAMDPGSWTLEGLGDGGVRAAPGGRAVGAQPGVRDQAPGGRAPACARLRTRSGRGDGVVDGVAFLGYEHDVELRDLEPNAIAAQAWNLIQLIPGGWVLLPTLSEVTPRAYFEPVRPEHVVSTPDALELPSPARTATS
jgi:hypothetical protein